MNPAAPASPASSGRAHRAPQAVRRSVGGLAAALAAAALSLSPPLDSFAVATVDPSPHELFQADRIADVQLTFAPAAWHTLAPVRGAFSGRAGDFVGPEGKRNGLASQWGYEFDFVHAGLSLDGRHFDDVAVRYKGNGSFIDAQSSGKFSFKLDLNKFVKGQDIGGVTTLNLHNAINDPAWMNEPIAYRLYRDARVPAPRTSYARVFVTVPERGIRQYAGLFVIVENVDEDFIADRFEEDSGALLKPVPLPLFDYLGDDWAAYRQAYDPKTELSSEQERRVIEFCRFVSRAPDSEFGARLGEYLDIESFARYMAVVVWLANTDSLLQTGQNFYLYLDPHTRRFVFIPWDQDASFGQFVRTGQRSLIGLRVEHPWEGPNRFLERVFNVNAFRSRYLATLDRFTKTVLGPERIIAQVEALASVLRPVVKEEPRDALVLFEQVVAGNAFRHPTTDVPMLPIRTFVQARARSVVAQLNELQ